MKQYLGIGDQTNVEKSEVFNRLGTLGKMVYDLPYLSRKDGKWDVSHISGNNLYVEFGVFFSITPELIDMILTWIRERKETLLPEGNVFYLEQRSEKPACFDRLIQGIGREGVVLEVKHPHPMIYRLVITAVNEATLFSITRELLVDWLVE